MHRDALAWNIVNHTTKFENSLVGFHCPRCGRFYASGPYTIEGFSIETGTSYVLASKELAECSGKKLPLPLIFFDITKASGFIGTLAVHWKDVVVLKKDELIVAHFRRTAAAMLH